MRFGLFLPLILIYFESLQFYDSHYLRGRQILRQTMLQRRRGTAFYHHIKGKDLMTRHWNRHWRGRDSNISNYDSKNPKTKFSISKPKPWRNDDDIAIRANRAAEIPADPNDTALEMKSNKKAPGRIEPSKQKVRV